MAFVSNVVDINANGQLVYGLTRFVYASEFAIDGYGLNTFGFIWGAGGIWTSCGAIPVTEWTACECNASCY
jgi:hypothetical protein